LDIGTLYTAPALSIRSDTSLREAARIMVKQEVGSAVVETPLGIITERDTLRAIADGVDLDRTPVADYMTTSPITARESTNVVEAARMMREGGFRHLIVLDGGGAVAGIFSMRDLIVKLLGVTPEGAVSWRIAPVVRED
jgi:CBS domain-containing protein